MSGINFIERDINGLNNNYCDYQIKSIRKGAVHLVGKSVIILYKDKTGLRTRSSILIYNRRQLPPVLLQMVV